MNGADRAAFGRVETAARLSRYGGDCYAYCMLAAGHVDLVIETGLKPHDVVPLVPIIAGAGGGVTTRENGPAHHRGRPLAAGGQAPPAAGVQIAQPQAPCPNAHC